MRVLSPFFASVIWGLLAAQSASANNSQNAAAHKSHARHSAAYVKPGAAVTLSHDYDGSTELGEFETLTVRLSHIYQDGRLSVDLLVPDELQISVFTPVRNMPVAMGTTLELPIQFSGTERGHFTLSLETVYRGPDGHESRRVLSIPVSIGSQTFEKARAAAQGETSTVSKTGVIGLAAIEVIE